MDMVLFLLSEYLFSLLGLAIFLVIITEKKII